MLEHERDSPSNRADRQVPLNRPLGSLHLSRGTVISNRQARHDIIELPFKRRICREGCPAQLSRRPERLATVHLVALANAHLGLE